ncbi:phasin family protein [Rhizorhapis sp. SPR117]|uniref:phasin family protein n=1 Tax=Rhizorhapis sp. SPR117 TaxID=2912611 RepID=UPI00235196B8
MAGTPPKSGPKKAMRGTYKPAPAKKPAAAPQAPEKKAVASPAEKPAPAIAPKAETPPAPVKAEALAPPPAPEPKKEEIAATSVAPAIEAAPEPEKNKPEIDSISAAAEEGTTVMTDAIETTKKVAAEAKEKFQAIYGEFNEKAKAAVEKSSKMLEEVNELTKGNVEAVVESGKIAAKGAEALGQEAAEYSRKSFEKATATMKSFASVKSPTEFFQLQSEFFSSAFDTMASEASKNSEAMLKLAGDVAQPLSTRMSLVSEKVKSFTS